MIFNIHHLNLFLDILSQFPHPQKIKQDILFTLLKRPKSLLMHELNYNNIFELGLTLGLYTKCNDSIILTNHGKNIVAMNNNLLDFSSEQINYIAIYSVLTNKKFHRMHEFLRKFEFFEQFKSFALFDEKISYNYYYELIILLQLKIMKKNGQFFVINIEYIEYLQHIICGITNSFTKSQLQSILNEQERIGKLAEDLTVKYEKHRLEKKGLIKEAVEVKSISCNYVDRGYDIESFSSKSFLPNLFIEVKGRKYNQMSFIMSINEFNVAKTLGNRYAIYFWNNLGSKIQPVGPTKIIRNPIEKLSIDKCKNCLNFLVTL